MLNTYVVEGGVGKCTTFTALLPKLRKKSELQIYTPYIDCFAGNPDVKLALEQTLPIQDPRIMASDNIYYCEPYKSNFQFGKQHIIESYCEHHMAPIIGTAHVAYVPTDRVVGISKLARVVDAFAKRLQVQEKMTAQIANTIDEVLRPRGVAVVLEGEHHCMSTRGVNKHGVSMVTSAMRGDFQKDRELRRDFMGIIGNPRSSI